MSRAKLVLLEIEVTQDETVGDPSTWQWSALLGTPTIVREVIDSTDLTEEQVEALVQATLNLREAIARGDWPTP